MKSMIIFASTLALAAPALAQQTTTPPASDAAVAAQADVATPAADTTATATATAQPSGVAGVVAAEFGAYDDDKSGELSQAEFAKWMIALKQKGEPDAKAKTTAELTTWAGAAFAQADANKSKTVSQTELTSFLQG